MKKLKPYLLTTGIVLGIFIIIFLLKGIYPFGKNSLIWSDMHDQIISMIALGEMILYLLIFLPVVELILLVF